MTDKQKAFVDEYLIDFNATQAAIRAGYSEDSAASIGSENLTKPEISRAVKEAIEARSRRTKVDQDYVLGLLTKTAERCLEGKVKMVFDPEEKAMVPATDDEGNIVWEFDSAGANRAAELIGKHLKMFTDKIDHTSGGQPFKALVGVDLEAMKNGSDPG